MLLEISWTIEFFRLARPPENPGLPPPGFSFRKAALCRRQAPPWSSALMLGSCVRDRGARADGQGGELVDCVAAGAPVRIRAVLDGKAIVNARSVA